jgi:hypothetical protein
MRRSMGIRPLLRSGLIALTIVLASGVWLVGSQEAADATTTHPPVAGTYEVSATGFTPFSLVLLRNRTLAGGGSWSVDRHVVTVQTAGTPAPIVICLNFHQPPMCNYSGTYAGTRTSIGFAGMALAYVGTHAFMTYSLNAVRTGKP